MKKTILHSTLTITVILLLISSSLLSITCAKKTVKLQEMRADKEWVQNINKYLSASYVEENDRAAFAWITSKDMLPSLYTTFSIVKILKAIGVEIENRDQIAGFINSLKNPNGAYFDSFSTGHRSNETGEALTVLTELGIQPENVNETVKYLLSLEYKDGTFLVSQNGITAWDNTKEQRIDNGTGVVIHCLSMLGQTEKIPERAINIIADYVSLKLGESNQLHGDDMRLIGAIRQITQIDPDLVTGRAREFISYQIKRIPEVTDLLYPSKALLLLDIASSLGISEAEDDSILENMRSYLNKYIFPMQNLSGGFGPSNTIDPMTTGEVVMLAERLGMEYPNSDKLMLNINNHWVGDGWTRFLIHTINNVSVMTTYYAIEIANFSGFAYDTSKVKRFLDYCLAGIPPKDGDKIRLQEIYYAVKALVAMNGELNVEEKRNAAELCLQFSMNLLNESREDIDNSFAYILPISKIVDFQLSDEILSKISKCAESFKKELLNLDKTLTPRYLQMLWESLEENSTVITKDEILKLLDSLYNADSGTYMIPALTGYPITPEESKTWIPEYALHSEVFQTYSAMELLFDVSENLPDKVKTINFVISCKQPYGFSRAPDWPDTNNIEATFAALMILKRTSEKE